MRPESVIEALLNVKVTRKRFVEGLLVTGASLLVGGCTKGCNKDGVVDEASKILTVGITDEMRECDERDVKSGVKLLGKDNSQVP